MTEENKDESLNLYHNGDLKISQNADGSVNASSEGGVTAVLDTIRSVGIKNLCDVDEHFINRVMGSVSHYITFFGGGELRFAYNNQGKIIELSAHGLTVGIQSGIVIFDVAPPKQV